MTLSQKGKSSFLTFITGGYKMTLLSYRGPYPLTHVKDLEGISDSRPEDKYTFDSPFIGMISQTHNWKRSDQLSWLGSFLLGERRLND